MSNLSEAKGIGQLFNSFRAVREIFPSVRLLLGGPIADEFARLTITEAQIEFGNAIEHLGLLGDKDKPDFFGRIDVFVNPTTGDTQGIVNLEALAYGVPVVATRMCCIPSDLGESGGVTAPLDSFSDVLVTFVKEHQLDPKPAGTKARERFEYLQQRHAVEQKRLIDILEKPESRHR